MVPLGSSSVVLFPPARARKSFVYLEYEPRGAGTYIETGSERSGSILTCSFHRSSAITTLAASVSTWIIQQYIANKKKGQQPRHSAPCSGFLARLFWFPPFFGSSLFEGCNSTNKEGFKTAYRCKLRKSPSFPERCASWH